MRIDRKRCGKAKRMHGSKKTAGTGLLPTARGQTLAFPLVNLSDEFWMAT